MSWARWCRHGGSCPHVAGTVQPLPAGRLTVSGAPLTLPLPLVHRPRSGLPPQSIVYNSVLAACEAAGQLGAALDILDEMRVAGVPRDCYTYSTAISTCCHVSGGAALPPPCMQPGLGGLLSGCLPAPASLNAVPCARSAWPGAQGGGQLEPALRLLREMEAEGLTPNTGGWAAAGG